MTIDIIGAGIGGLTTAIALEQKGFNVRVFEQTEKMRPVGAGIMLAINAMQVYEKFGLYKVIEKNGNPISSIKITNTNLKTITKVDLNYFEQKYKVRNIAIHRGALQQILLNRLKSSEVFLGHKLKEIAKVDGQYILSFENRKQIHSAILLGADGIHSTVRQKLFTNNGIRNAKQICWRGVAAIHLPLVLKNDLYEVWGKEGRFGFVQIAPNKVYWFALKSFRKSADELSINKPERYFDKYNPIIKEIIAATPKAAIHTAEIADLKPINTWYKDSVCLLGDAAHAATPNMGQGACQAIEDAYILSACLKKFKPDRAFQEYQKLRLPKAHQVVRTSWVLGKTAHLANPLSIFIRNQMMRIAPKLMGRKQTEQIFQLNKV